ncbi:hypothetical protein H7849_11905 [Alloacidobacterium dinghuense]|uniref:DUF7210 domain-containing protein n=1 Tax=Alloacidobacterium dinghuense TaxID=2763107 RepID=A0A7G8BPR0_9BACT|nr:hypothetical protein [Alloacidobacterium dinghuense]QNI34530.1 hypothetical protein H7849_11905 [Alloacidobacterium dinghuense]
MAKAKAADQSTKKYRVKQPLRHNLKHYGAGSIVELSADEAKTLIERGVVAKNAADVEAEAKAE